MHHCCVNTLYSDRTTRCFAHVCLDHGNWFYAAEQGIIPHLSQQIGEMTTRPISLCLWTLGFTCKQKIFENAWIFQSENAWFSLENCPIRRGQNVIQGRGKGKVGGGESEGERERVFLVSLVFAADRFLSKLANMCVCAWGDVMLEIS